MLALIPVLIAAGLGPSATFQTCMDHAGGVSMKMLQCGSAEIVRVDARLNTTYHRFMATLPAPQAARFRDTQRVWLHHHLRETRRLADDPNTGSLALLKSQRFELQDLGDRAVLLEGMVARHR